MDGIGIGPGGEGVGLEWGTEITKKVILCCPTISHPHPRTLEWLEEAIPHLHEAGWEEGIVFEIGCPYISAARNKMLRKALDQKPGVIVFLDHDVSAAPKDLLTLVETPGDVVCGTYRFKKDEEEYMGLLMDDPVTHRPIVREDGCIRAELIPAGFLKITPKAVDKFMIKHPRLCFGPQYRQEVDLFNHGVENGRWYSEDYAFSRHWLETGGDIWIVPTLQIDHHDKDKCFKGNFHEFLLRCPGGSKHQKEHYDVEIKGGLDGATVRSGIKQGKKDRHAGKARLGKTGNSRHQPRSQA